MDGSRSLQEKGYASLAKRFEKSQEVIASLYAKAVQRKRVQKAPDAEIVSLFITPSVNRSSGAIRSIFSLHSQSRSLLKEKRGASFLCSHPLSKRIFLKNSSFQNDETVFQIEPLLKRYRGVEKLYLHVPDYMVSTFRSEEVIRLLREHTSLEKLTFNIVVQNIQQIPSEEELKAVKGLFPQMTMTTTNHAYSDRAMREKWEIPLHHFSTFIDPGSYRKSAWREKEELLIVSPEDSPGKETFLREVDKRLPALRVFRVRDMCYGDYKKIMEQAKWSVTFSRGLDSYFVESIFCGSVAFSIQRDFFLNKGFAAPPNLLSSEEELLDNFFSLLEQINCEEAYNEINGCCCKALAALYSFERYRQNIKRYYEGEIDFP